MFEQSGHQSKEYDHSYASNKAKTEVLGNREDKKDYGNNDCHGNDFSIRNRDAQIQQINREYNAKIHEVKHQRALISYEKNQQIRNLQQEK